MSSLGGSYGTACTAMVVSLLLIVSLLSRGVHYSVVIRWKLAMANAFW